MFTFSCFLLNRDKRTLSQLQKQRLTNDLKQCGVKTVQKKTKVRLETGLRYEVVDGFFFAAKFLYIY